MEPRAGSVTQPVSTYGPVAQATLGAPPETRPLREPSAPAGGLIDLIRERWGGISKIRLFFIYSSFLAVGFPLIFYFFAGIVLDIRNYVKRGRAGVTER